MPFFRDMLFIVSDEVSCIIAYQILMTVLRATSLTQENLTLTDKYSAVVVDLCSSPYGRKETLKTPPLPT